MSAHAQDLPPRRPFTGAETASDPAVNPALFRDLVTPDIREMRDSEVELPSVDLTADEATEIETAPATPIRPRLGIPQDTQFHVLSFEGPDAYSRIGGLETRVAGLCEALVHAGLDTHLWFVGQPDLPGYEERERLHLHRWCQWLSQYHPRGVYDGE